MKKISKLLYHHRDKFFFVINLGAAIGFYIRGSYFFACWFSFMAGTSLVLWFTDPLITGQRVLIDLLIERLEQAYNGKQ